MAGACSFCAGLACRLVFSNLYPCSNLHWSPEPAKRLLTAQEQHTQRLSALQLRAPVSRPCLHVVKSVVPRIGQIRSSGATSWVSLQALHDGTPQPPQLLKPQLRLL